MINVLFISNLFGSGKYVVHVEWLTKVLTLR